jgi:hypothetical protein
MNADIQAMEDGEAKSAAMEEMPRAPALRHHKHPAAESFWIVKHGTKMTGMPACDA